MAGIPELTVNLGQLAKHHNRIPDQDFINARFDSEHAAMTENLLVILSTPRSGSTLLCDMLRQHEVCIPHEYFQPYQYMPLLADRWGCIKGNVIDTHAYSAALRRFRTYTNGWLGINLHGEHLRIFLHFEE